MVLEQNHLRMIKNLLESLGAEVGLQPEAVHVTDHRVGAFLRQLN